MANLSARLLDRLALAIEGASWLDPVSEAYQKVAGLSRRSRLLTNLLSGTYLGHPAHPLLVTIPLGAWTGASLLDVIGNRRGARALVGLGVLSAVPTSATGSSDWHDTAGAEQRIGTLHALLNTATTACFAVSYLERRRGRHVRGIVWTAPGLALMSASGWLGGHLSYALGVGVDTTAFQAGETDWVDVADEASAREHALTQVELDGVSVLLSRVDGRVVAYADRCTHRGGPLHEGTVEDGCVVCPWHDSRFDLRDGHVEVGPATRPQPRYDVHLRDGRILLRRSELPRTLRTRPVGA